MNCPHTQAGACSFCYKDLQQKLSDLSHDFPVGWHETYKRMKEKIQELEKELAKIKLIEQDWLKHDCGILMERNKGLEKELAVVKEELRTRWQGTTAVIHKGEMTAESFAEYRFMKEENQRMREALEFYKSQAYYPDNGEVAKDALTTLTKLIEGEKKP